jgi:hypothetical protein
MHANAEMIPVRSVHHRLKESSGEVNSSICLIHCKNLWKCHNVPSPSTTIKEKYLTY